MWRSIGNQAIKVAQLIEYKVRNISSGQHLSFNIICWSSVWTCNKIKLRNFRLFIQRHAQTWFFRKGYGISFSTIFCAWFLEKYFWYILIIVQISLSDCPFFPKVLRNMCIVIICFPAYDIISFEINLSFFIKSFFYMAGKVRTKI